MLRMTLKPPRRLRREPRTSIALGIELDCTVTPLRAEASTVTAVVNAREVISDGVCSSNSATDTSDVDCGFKKFFTPPNVTDPLPPIGAPYVHGRAVYYHVKSWANAAGKPDQQT